MPRAIRWLDAAGAWGLILIGCLHNFYGAPASFDGLSDDLFWFVSAGLALWYAGAFNLVRQAAPSRITAWPCLAVDLSLLAFVAAFGLHSGAIARPDGMLLVGLAAIETLFAAAQSASSLSARTQSP